MDISRPAAMAFMKVLVPNLAMIPNLFTRSFLVIPMPDSSIPRVKLVLSKEPDSQ